VLALTVACQFDPSGAAQEDAAVDTDGPTGGARIDAPPGSQFRKSISVSSGTTVQDLTNFPLYIELQNDVDLRDRALLDGSDIFFVASDGGALEFEREAWDKSTGTLVAWVRVPSITIADGVVIYVRYGDAAVAAAPNPAAVWTNQFLAVWHLADDPASGEADAIVDSLGVRHGTAHSSMDSTAVVDAALGSGLELDGNDDEIIFENPLIGTSGHTMSAWVNQEVTGDNDALLVLGNGACNQSRWWHTRFGGGTVATGFYCDDWNSNHNIQAAGWKLLHWTYDTSANSRMFVDGQLIAGPFVHNGNQNTQGTVGRIGNAPGAWGQNMGLNATVDEIRIASVVRSVGWIASEFANQSSPETFYLVGPEEP